jgi:RNA-directed DNA polymerase
MIFCFCQIVSFFLNWVKREVVCFLEKNLFLVLNPKKANLFLVKKGVSFLGYVIFPFYKLLRKSTVKRFIKRIKKQICSVETGFVNENDLKTSLVSWRAYAKDANSFMLRKSLIDNLGSNKKLFSVLLE